ncbi:MAG: trigger factor [Patescibacteria group bacterium]
MKYEIKKLDKSQLEFTITVEAKDYQQDLENAAVRLSERAAIKGFRPGKAPYEMVKQQLGEIKILEEAMQNIVEKNFFEATHQEKINTVGMPQITIEKVAPGNEFVFKAVVALLPKVTLPDFSGIKVKQELKEVGEKEVSDVLNDLKKMQPKEIIKNDKAAKEDKIVLNMEMFIDKVTVEGGHSQSHQVYLSEPHYIPGFAEQLIGLKKDDEKEFTLKFPETHYQKHLAGKNVDFKIKVKDVFELQYPELNDDFAKALGQESMEKLKVLLVKNLTEDAQHKSEQKMEIEIFEQLIAKAQFDEIPEVLLDSEKHKMFHELKHQLEHQGIEMEHYLKDLKKTEKQIHDDFTENATKRVKAALISRQIAVDNNIKAEEPEIKQEIEMIKKAYPGDKTVEENLKNPEVISTIALTVQNRKVLAFLKEKVVK